MFFHVDYVTLCTCILLWGSEIFEIFFGGPNFGPNKAGGFFGKEHFDTFGLKKGMDDQFQW